MEKLRFSYSSGGVNDSATLEVSLAVWLPYNPALQLLVLHLRELKAYTYTKQIPYPLSVSPHFPLLSP